MTNDTWSADDAQLSVLRDNVRNADPVCIICRKSILDGELVTGQDWTGQGGQHLSCLQASGK